MTSITTPANATIEASFLTDRPAARITMISLFAAIPPRPSKEPINADTGSISKARLGNLTCDEQDDPAASRNLPSMSSSCAMSSNRPANANSTMSTSAVTRQYRPHQVLVENPGHLNTRFVHVVLHGKQQKCRKQEQCVNPPEADAGPHITVLYPGLGGAEQVEIDDKYQQADGQSAVTAGSRLAPRKRVPRKSRE